MSEKVIEITSDKAYELEEFLHASERANLLEDIERQELAGYEVGDDGDDDDDDEEEEEDDENNANGTVPQQPPASPLDTTKAPQKKPTAYLDGLRGLAALAVFTQHYISGDAHYHGFGENGNFYTISFPFLRVFYSGGAAAVAIFFVLSGFVISQTSIKLFHKGQRNDSLKSLVSAVIRRPFRLYLPCWAIALIIALLLQLPYDIYPPSMWSQPRENLGAELVHWFWECITYFQPFREHRWMHGSGVFDYDIVMWTIPIEFKGSMLVYALAPLCCFALATPIWAVGVLAILIVTAMQLGFWTVGCFTAGLMLTIVDVYALDITHVLSRIKSRITRGLLMNFVLLLGWYLLSQPSPDGRPEWSLDTPGWHTLTKLIPPTYDVDNYYRFWQTYGATLVVYATLRLSWLQWIFSTGPFRYLGRVSFMLYLVHVPLMSFIGDRVTRIFGNVPFGSEHRWQDDLLWIPDVGPKGLSLRWTVDWTFELALSLAVAHAATRFIDEPCVRLGRKLTQMMGLS